MAAGGAFISSPLGLISWKIPLVTASLFAAMGAYQGWKEVYIKLTKEELEKLENIYPVTETLKEVFISN